MNEGGAVGTRQRIADDRFEPAPVDLAHREDAQTEPRMSSRSPASSDRTPTSDDAAGSSDGQGPGVAREAVRDPPERRRQRHAVDVAARVVSGVFRSPCASSQSAAPGPWTDAMPAERAERDGVVAAEHEREVRPRRLRVATRAATPSQVSMISAEEARPCVARSSGLGSGGATLPRSRALEPELVDPLAEPCVADRRRAHVDTAAPCAEVERGADDRHMPLGHAHDTIQASRERRR